MRILILGATSAGFLGSLWLLALLWPAWRIARGNTRRLLGTLLLLGATLLASNAFWQAVILIPETVRSQGTAGYPFVLAGFTIIQLAPVMIALRLWRDLQRVNG